MTNSRSSAAISFIICGLLSQAFFHRACAHPLSQGRFEVVLYRDKITLWASVAIEQVVVQQSLPVSTTTTTVNTQSEAYRSHGDYLLQHIYLDCDGKHLSGRVIAIQEPESKTAAPGDPGKEYAIYEIEYALDSPPLSIALKQDVLHEVEFSPNNPWQATYITGIRQGAAQGQENLLLTSTNTVHYTCDWSSASAAVPASPATRPTTHAPPENLKRAIPDAPLDRSHFIAGIAIGLCAIYLLGLLIKKMLKRKNSV